MLLHTLKEKKCCYRKDWLVARVWLLYCFITRLPPECGTFSISIISVKAFVLGLISDWEWGQHRHTYNTSLDFNYRTVKRSEPLYTCILSQSFSFFLPQRHTYKTITHTQPLYIHTYCLFLSIFLLSHTHSLTQTLPLCGNVDVHSF